MTRPLVIIGAGEFADIAHEYFTADSDYEVVGFSVESAYLKGDAHRGLPLVAYEEIETHFDPQNIAAHVAITNTSLNRIRERLVCATRAKGYSLANYVSSRAFVWRTAVLEQNVFIFEGNVVQHGVRVGNGVVLWSGNHIGHQSEIDEFVFISSHCVISGYCRVGRRCFIGVNASLADRVEIGADCFVAMGAVVNKSYLDPGQLLTGHPAVPSKVSAYRYLKLKD